MSQPANPAFAATPADRGTLLETLRWQKFPVLDDGFVALVDCMGDDGAVVQAARVSYGEGTRKVSDDRQLIRYLMRHAHTTPFEMAEIKFVVRVPMDCWRQWIRHRTASVNEYSTRYSLAIDSMQTTAGNEWRTQATNNRQGSAGLVTEEQGVHLTQAETELQNAARQVYEARLSAGIAREQARKDLPLSTYTEAYWKIDLHNLFHFLALRMDSHAQLEIRRYAETIGHEIVAKLFPLCWEAFLDYRVEAMRLTRLDQGVIRRLTERSGPLPASHDDFLKAQDPSWANMERSRERDECLAKLIALGLIVQ